MTNNSSMLCIDNNNNFSGSRSHLNKIVDVQHHLKNRTNKQNPPNNQKTAQACDCCGASTIFLFFISLSLIWKENILSNIITTVFAKLLLHIIKQE